MAEKKIQPKRPTATDEPAAGARKAEKTSAKAMKARRFSASRINARRAH